MFFPSSSTTRHDIFTLDERDGIACPKQCPPSVFVFNELRWMSNCNLRFSKYYFLCARARALVPTIFVVLDVLAVVRYLCHLVSLHSCVFDHFWRAKCVLAFSVRPVNEWLTCLTSYGFPSHVSILFYIVCGAGLCDTHFARHYKSQFCGLCQISSAEKCTTVELKPIIILNRN